MLSTISDLATFEVKETNDCFPCQNGGKKGDPGMSPGAAPKGEKGDSGPVGPLGVPGLVGHKHCVTLNQVLCLE
ncbi:unnamed protein product [Arctogadus glacialis]